MNDLTNDWFEKKKQQGDDNNDEHIIISVVGERISRRHIKPRKRDNKEQQQPGRDSRRGSAEDLELDKPNRIDGGGIEPTQVQVEQLDKHNIDDGKRQKR